jgi:drug/metabolite transporter (DMT)-like permease
MAANPLATLGLAHAFAGSDERVTPRRALGFLSGFAGVLLLVGPDALRQLGGGAGDALRQAAILGGALCYAANSVLVRRLPPTAPLVSSAAVLMLACAFIVPVALAVDQPFARPPDRGALLAVLWLGLVPTAAATIVYFRLIASAGPTFLSLVNYPVPLVAVAAGALVYGEQPAPSALAALALILSGLALGQPRASPPSAPSQEAR